MLIPELQADEAGVEKTKVPVSEASKDAALAIIGGSDTTATAVCNFFVYMLTHRDVYDKLQRELDEVFPAGSDPTDLAKSAAMPYLTACMYVHTLLISYGHMLTVYPKETNACTSPSNDHWRRSPNSVRRRRTAHR